MRCKFSSFAQSTVIAAAMLVLGAAPSSAGHADGFAVRVGAEVHFGHRAERTRPWYRQSPIAGTGPGLYYAYHYDHVPGYPVPIYRSYNRPSVHRPALRYRSVSSAHVGWCHARYRSYRGHDNTFQPYHGSRRQCWSPYG